MLLSRAEGLENEEIQIRELSEQLAAIEKTKDLTVLEEARKLISILRSINLRWNIPQLDAFLKQRQKELFYDL